MDRQLSKFAVLRFSFELFITIIINLVFKVKMSRNRQSSSSTSSSHRGGEKTCCEYITDFLMSIYLAIVTVISFIWNGIRSILSIFVGCFEFFWYPIKEKGAGCLRYCSSKRERSQDPTYSTFSNEI